MATPLPTAKPGALLTGGAAARQPDISQPRDVAPVRRLPVTQACLCRDAGSPARVARYARVVRASPPLTPVDPARRVSSPGVQPVLSKTHQRLLRDPKSANSRREGCLIPSRGRDRNGASCTGLEGPSAAGLGCRLKSYQRAASENAPAPATEYVVGWNEIPPNIEMTPTMMSAISKPNAIPLKRRQSSREHECHAAQHEQYRIRLSRQRSRTTSGPISGGFFVSRDRSARSRLPSRNVKA